MVRVASDILIVDDHADTAFLYATALRRAGFRVRVAESGQAAVVEIGYLAPAVVILDLHLGDMDGQEVLSWLRSREDMRQTPVLVVTADGRARIDDPHSILLLKPVELEQVIRLIQAMAGSNRRLQVGQ